MGGENIFWWWKETESKQRKRRKLKASCYMFFCVWCSQSSGEHWQVLFFQWEMSLPALRLHAQYAVDTPTLHPHGWTCDCNTMSINLLLYQPPPLWVQSVHHLNWWDHSDTGGRHGQGSTSSQKVLDCVEVLQWTSSTPNWGYFFMESLCTVAGERQTRTAGYGLQGQSEQLQDVWQRKTKPKKKKTCCYTEFCFFSFCLWILQAPKNNPDSTTWMYFLHIQGSQVGKASF